MKSPLGTALPGRNPPLAAPLRKLKVAAAISPLNNPNLNLLASIV